MTKMMGGSFLLRRVKKAVDPKESQVQTHISDLSHKHGTKPFIQRLLSRFFTQSFVTRSQYKQFFSITGK